jgi:hypothetical protein
MDVFLEVQTTEPQELRAVITGKTAPGETEVKVTDQLSLRFAGISHQRSIDATALVTFALTFPMGVATSVIADRISDFIRRRDARDHLQRAFITIEERVESIDANGKRTVKMTTRREEISFD